MTKSHLETYRQQLLNLQSRLDGDVVHLAQEALRENQKDAGGNLSSMPIHMADLGTDNYEQENTLNLLANEKIVLEEIADALDRIKEGTYGLCEECQKEIPKARLEVLPYARYCVACAKNFERHS